MADSMIREDLLTEDFVFNLEKSRPKPIVSRSQTLKYDTARRQAVLYSLSRAVYFNHSQDRTTDSCLQCKSTSYLLSDIGGRDMLVYFSSFESK